MLYGVKRRVQRAPPNPSQPHAGVIEVTMLDPVLHHLHHAPMAARWMAQLVQLDPELAAALPLLAARLVDAGGIDEEDEDGDEVPEPMAV